MSACTDHQGVVEQHQDPVLPLTPNQCSLQPPAALDQEYGTVCMPLSSKFRFAHIPLSGSPYVPIPHHNLPLVYFSEFNATSPSPKPSSYFLDWVKCTYIATCPYLIFTMLSYKNAYWILCLPQLTVSFSKV